MSDGEYYAELDGEQGHARIDGWRHYLEQWLRFEVVGRALALDARSSVVDLGCGTGRFLDYLGESGVRRYVGVERRASAIRRARNELSSGTFLQTDIFAGVVDEAGPYDFAVAIGTLVDGRSGVDADERLMRLRRLVLRLNALGRRGWALVVLNQDLIDGDPIRSLEPCLTGASPAEVSSVLKDVGLKAAVDNRCLPSDLFVISHAHDEVEQWSVRISADAPHHAVLSTASRRGAGIDNADKAWFWIVTKRLKQARHALDKVRDDHPRKSILKARLSALRDEMRSVESETSPLVARDAAADKP